MRVYDGAAATQVGCAGRARAPATAGAGGGGGGRRLLNTAKAALRVDAGGELLECERGLRDEYVGAAAVAAGGGGVADVYWLAVSVEREGVAASATAAAAAVPFNLLLDPLLGGAVPSTVLRLLGAATVAVGLMLAAWRALRARRSPFGPLFEERGGRDGRDAAE